jgi:hypothetical protein
MRTRVTALLAVLLACTGPAAVGQALDDKLSVHGYLTQAYARSAHHQLLGINEEGTFDYRTGALQVRYDMDAANAFVLQLSHERVGASPIAQLKDDLEVDWLFYQHRFADSTSVRLGRVPIPAGIYNEIRDVGTLLPFYRPPDDVYRDTSFASETLEGVVVSRRFGRGDWGLEVQPYLGQFDFFAGTTTVNQGRHAYGVQLWLETPVDSLRLGAGARRLDHVTQGMDLDEVSQWSAALDARVGRFILQGEYVAHDWRNPAGAARLTGNLALAYADVYYGLIGLRPVEKIGVYAQASFTEVGFYSPLTRGRIAIDDYSEDLAAVVNIALRPDVVLKVEGHRNEGRGVEDDPQALLAPEPAVTRYGIVSLSVSF